MRSSFVLPGSVAAFLALSSVTHAELQIRSTLACSALSNSWVQRGPFTSELPFTLTGNILKGERKPGNQRPGGESYVGSIDSNKLIKVTGRGAFFDGSKPQWQYRFSGSINNDSFTSIKGSLDTKLGEHRECSITFLLAPAEWEAILTEALSIQPKAQPAPAQSPTSVPEASESSKDDNPPKKTFPDAAPARKDIKTSSPDTNGAERTGPPSPDHAVHDRPSVADAVYGKWSDSADKKTCEIPVGSSPDEATLYKIGHQGIFFYEFDCAARDINFHEGGVDFNLDCFKGGNVARWFETALARPQGSNQLKLTFKNRKPSLGDGSDRVETLYKCSAGDTDVPVQAANLSRWTHNGSIMSLVQNKESIEIDYIQPRPSMLAVGVRANTPLFLGTRTGDAVEGTAYIFHPDCGPAGYQVSGRFSANGNALVLSGGAPRLAQNCEATKEITETLRFERVATSSVRNQGPSFDCAVATSPDERAICGSAELSQLDHLIANGFKYVRTRFGDQLAKSIAVQTLQNRRACGSDSACIKKIQIAAIEEYQRRGANLEYPTGPLTASSDQQVQASGVSEIYDYSCKVKGSTYPLRVDADARVLNWLGKQYSLTVADCGRAGWHAEGNGTSFDFCTATKGYAAIQKGGKVEVECDLKRADDTKKEPAADPIAEAFKSAQHQTEKVQADSKVPAPDHTKEWGRLFTSQVERCLKKPGDPSPTEDINLTIRITMNRDGSFSEPPRPLYQVEPTASVKAYQDRALRALNECQPYQLPVEFYGEWKSFDPTFIERKAPSSALDLRAKSSPDESEKAQMTPQAGTATFEIPNDSVGKLGVFIKAICQMEECDWTALKNRLVIGKSENGVLIGAQFGGCVLKQGRALRNNRCTTQILTRDEAAFCSVSSPSIASRNEKGEWEYLNLSISDRGIYGNNREAISDYLRVCHGYIFEADNSMSLDLIGAKFGYSDRFDKLGETERGKLNSVRDMIK